MQAVTSFFVPVILGGILLFAAVRGVSVFDEFISGAKEGLSSAVKILPALIGLMTAVGMFKASGALDVLTHALSPLSGALGMPGELVPLALLRPISGSGALAIFETILTAYGPDSSIGRMAAVMQGSTETTFYALAVYYGSVDVKRTRYTVFCALIADFVGFVMSGVAVRLLF